MAQNDDPAAVLAKMRRDKKAAPGPGMLWHVIWRAAREVKADIILLDLSPAVNALNKNMLMHCDYFIAPCLPDQFSQKALERLGLNFGEWYRDFAERRQVSGSSGLRQASRGVYPHQAFPALFPLPSMRPQFAGIILSGYVASPICVNLDTKRQGNGGGNGGAVERPHGTAAELLSSFIIRRAQQVAEVLTPPRAAGAAGGAAGAAAPNHQATQNPFAVPSSLFPHASGSNEYPQPHILARIRKATSGFEHAGIQFGKPFPFLTDEDLANSPEGFNLKNDPHHKEAVAHFQRIYLDMAQFLVDLPIDHNCNAQGEFEFNMPQPNGEDGAEGGMAFF